MKLYNEEIKEKFLSNYKENSRNVIRRVFENSYSAEVLLGKDLYDFTTKEVEKVLKNLSPHNLEVAKSLSSYISSYVTWAAEQGLRTSNIPFSLQGVDDEYFKKFVDQSKKVHWSEKEFYELINSLINYQDQALLILLFNGIMGKGFIELQELETKDIDIETGEIYIKNRDEKIKLFNKTDTVLLLKASEQKTYYIDDKERELIPSKYVLKNTLSRKDKESRPISKIIIYNRLNNIKEKMGLEYFTPKSIIQSGMIKMAVDLWNEYGKLEKEEFNKIGDRFKLSKINYGGYEYYNRHAMKIYINEQNIKELYGIDVYIP